MSKPCSPKSKYVANPQYECGPKGRYRKKAEFKTKRTPTAYNLYTKAQYQTVKAGLSSSGKKPTLGDVAKVLGQKWKSMSKAEKSAYELKPKH